MLDFRKSLAGAALAVLAVAAAVPARAAYPERAITLIVPFAPGGPTDIIARILATALRASLGQPVIIDNRAGRQGIPGWAWRRGRRRTATRCS
jgi:tripartite-type tricarboxylate transporter receptor subunit TctC